jgi:hypothetical protein
MELVEVSNTIQIPPLMEGADRWKWEGIPSGVFLVGLLWKEIELVHCGSFGYIHEWCNWIPRKVSIFSWKATLGRLPSCEELQKRGGELIVCMLSVVPGML